VSTPEGLPGEFRYQRRVQFAETDLAGIVHFSWYFRYMEEAEHALWRAAGLTIARAGETIGWPRVSATFDYSRPLHFEDEIEVIVRIAAVNARTIQYAVTILRVEALIGRGSMTIACVRKGPEAPMASMDIPRDVVERLRRVLEGTKGTEGTDPHNGATKETERTEKKETRMDAD
jgi:acyl-CoA thioester hydrolase